MTHRNNKIGIYISSYIETEERANIVIECLKTLIIHYGEYENIEIKLYDDGSPLDKVLSNKLIRNNIEIIKLGYNAGIASVKNICIKDFHDSNNEYGIFIDDDVTFYNSEGIFKYVEHMIKHNVPHLTANSHPDKGFYDNELVKCNVILGYMFTLTKEVVNKVGYFHVLPYRYGYEHVNYSERIKASGLIEEFLDIKDSDKYLNTSAEIKSFNVDFKKVEMNNRIVNKNKKIYVPLAVKGNYLQRIEKTDENGINFSYQLLTDADFEEKVTMLDRKIKKEKPIPIKHKEQYTLFNDGYILEGDDVVNVIMLTNTKNENFFRLTNTAVETLYKSETDFRFNIILLESNPNTIYKYSNCQQYIVNEPFNYNRYLNIGLKILHEQNNSKWLLISNNDVIFNKKWFKHMYDIHNRTGIKSFSSVCPIWDRHKGLNSRKNYILGYDIGQHVCGWNIVLHTSVLDKIGHFDEQFNFWYQDNDYAENLKKHGIPHALSLNSRVKHLLSKSSSKQELEKLRNDDNANKFLAKWG